jgi:hypothetical protein
MVIVLRQIVRTEADEHSHQSQTKNKDVLARSNVDESSLSTMYLKCVF